MKHVFKTKPFHLGFEKNSSLINRNFIIVIDRLFKKTGEMP